MTSPSHCAQCNSFGGLNKDASMLPLKWLKYWTLRLSSGPLLLIYLNHSRVHKQQFVVIKCTIMGKSVMYLCSLFTLIKSVLASFNHASHFCDIAIIRNRDARVWKRVAAPPPYYRTVHLCIHSWWSQIGDSPHLFTCTTQPRTPGRSLATWGHHDTNVLQLSSLTTNW